MNKPFAEAFDEAKKKAEKLCKEIAAHLGVSISEVSNWLHGRGVPHNEAMVIELEKFLGAPEHSLQGRYLNEVIQMPVVVPRDRYKSYVGRVEDMETFLGIEHDLSDKMKIYLVEEDCE